MCYENILNARQFTQVQTCHHLVSCKFINFIRSTPNSIAYWNSYSSQCYNTYMYVPYYGIIAC